MTPDFSKIKAIAYDVDGVMTDGGILALPDGDLLRIYDAKDCFGVRMAILKGLTVGVITGGHSQSIRLRMRDSMGVLDENIYLAARDKMKSFRDFCEHNSLDPSEVVYFGDDLPDIAVMKACGIGVAPADACVDTLAAADYVSPMPGGKGCVRHTIEMILRQQGKWEFDVGAYEQKY